ncbi:MAG: tetratricopeptide repeat protein, partial [Myxococcales bacterium]|nr:tetratricopeptide repeat protein [Myxococcales bacterium]
VQAFEMAGEDPLAKAETALLLHLRYGPDPERLQLAQKLLEPFSQPSESHVARVIGLALYADGKLDPAASKLVADDARSQLYRAWLLFDQGKLDEAREAADRALEQRPEDRAAQLLILRIRLAANPTDGLAAMRKAAEEQADHLALQEVLMRTLLDQGLLAEAADVAGRIQPSTVSNAHKAMLLRDQAAIALEQGRTDVAMRQLDQALATDPTLLDARLDRIRLWLDNQDLASARSDIEILLQEQAQNPEVIKIAVRLDIETGDRKGEAMTRLQSLGEAATKDPEAQDLLAQLHALTMKIAEARTAWAEARKIDPTYVPATQNEVELLIKAEQVPQALAFLDEQRKALSEVPESAAQRRALAAVDRARATTLRAEGRTEDALLAADDAIATDASDNQARLLRAQLLAALGRRAAEEEALLDLHQRTGGFPGLTEPLGNVLLRQGKLDELEKLIGTSLDSPAASAEILLTGAALRLAQDKPDVAKLLVQKVLDRDATSSRAHLLMGRALLAQGDYAAALTEMQSAQTREGNPEAELWLGQALEYNGRAKESKAHYKKAIELDPNNLEAAALLGRLYAYDGATTEAIKLIQPVIDKTDAYPYAYLALGLAHRDLGKRDLAVKEFKKARELDPTLFEAYYQEGRIHNDGNKHSAAVAALQEGMDKAIANAQERELIDAWRRLGESYYEIGRRADAKKALEEYLKLAAPNA